MPQQLVDTSHRDTATSIFGHRVAAPVGFAPIGINRIYHEYRVGDLALQDPAFRERLVEAGIDPHKDLKRAGQE